MSHLGERERKLSSLQPLLINLYSLFCWQCRLRNVWTDHAANIGRIYCILLKVKSPNIRDWLKHVWCPYTETYVTWVYCARSLERPFNHAHERTFFPFRPRYECVLHWSSLLSCVQMRHLLEIASMDTGWHWTNESLGRWMGQCPFLD